jgi:hypothetical protein
MLAGYDAAVADTGGGSAGGGGGASGGGGGLSLPLVGSALGIATTLGSMLWRGAVVSVEQPLRLFRIFVRSGYIESIAAEDGWQAIRLAVVESAPLVGGLVGVPMAAGAWLRGRSRGDLLRYLRSPVGAVDAVAAGVAVLFVFMYVPKLPLHAQVTVRYLHPIYFLGVYALVRLPVVRSALTSWTATAVWSYAASVLVGGQLVVLYLVAIDAGLGEAVQFHALLAHVLAVGRDALGLLAGLAGVGMSAAISGAELTTKLPRSRIRGIRRFSRIKFPGTVLACFAHLEAPRQKGEHLRTHSHRNEYIIPTPKSVL